MCRRSQSTAAGRRCFSKTGQANHSSRSVRCWGGYYDSGASSRVIRQKNCGLRAALQLRAAAWARYPPMVQADSRGRLEGLGRSKVCWDCRRPTALFDNHREMQQFEVSCSNAWSFWMFSMEQWMAHRWLTLRNSPFDLDLQFQAKLEGHLQRNRRCHDGQCPEFKEPLPSIAKRVGVSRSSAQSRWNSSAARPSHGSMI